MAKYFLSRSEQETTISFNVAEDSADLSGAIPIKPGREVSRRNRAKV